MAAKKKRKNSLVENINRRKRSGTSRPKSRSTVSPGAYDAMQEGWPSQERQRRKKTARAKTGAKKARAKTDAKKARTKTGAKKARNRRKAGKTSGPRASRA